MIMTMAQSHTVTVQILLVLLVIVHLQPVSCKPVVIHKVVEPHFIVGLPESLARPEHSTPEVTGALPFNPAGRIELHGNIMARQQQTSTEKVKFTKMHKLATGLSAGLGGLLLLSIILCIVGYKNKWHQRLHCCGNRNNDRSTPPPPPPLSDLPHHPLYRASLRSTKTGTSLKSPASNYTTSDNNCCSYHSCLPNPVTSYFQPVEVYRTLMVPNGLMQGPASSSRSPSSPPPPPLRNPMRNHSNARTPPNLQLHPSADPEINSQSPITRYRRSSSIYSPQPRRVGLPINPRYGLESGLGIAIPPPAKVGTQRFVTE